MCMSSFFFQKDLIWVEDAAEKTSELKHVRMLKIPAVA